MTDRAIDELESVKRLLIVLLLKLGASPDEIGVGLNLSGRRVRQMGSVGRVKRMALSSIKE